MGHPYWPLFDLEVRTPRITMRYVDDDLAVEMATLAAKGIHDPADDAVRDPVDRRRAP